MNNTPKQSEVVWAGERVKVYQSGSRGRYVADFHFKGHRKKSLTTCNKKHAIKKAKLIEAQLMNGSYSVEQKSAPVLAPATKGIREAINEFISWHETEGRRYKTSRRYRGILEKLQKFAAETGIHLLDGLKLPLIDAYRSKQAETLSARTMHNEGQVFKAFLNWCEEREYIERNPLYKRSFTRPKPKARKAPTQDNVNAVLTEASKLRMPQLATLMFTGMRSGELRNLRVEDVDFEGRWIHIMSRPGYETKNGESRKVPMHPRLGAILEKLPRPKSGWFFRALPSNRYPGGDHHISPKRLNEDFKKELERLQLPAGREEGFTVHSLRRFFRTSTVNSNVPERESWIYGLGTAIPNRWVRSTTTYATPIRSDLCNW